jgi:hypothetical protein
MLEDRRLGRASSNSVTHWSADREISALSVRHAWLGFATRYARAFGNAQDRSVRVRKPAGHNARELRFRAYVPDRIKFGIPGVHLD